MKRIIHGVLFDDGILTASGLRGSKLQTQNIKNISDICEIMKNLKLNQIWILRGSHVFNRLALNHRKTFADGQAFGFMPKQIKNVITVWGNGLKRSAVIFAGSLEVGAENNQARENLMNQWSLSEIDNPQRLFDAVKWLYEKLDVLPTVPIRTGKTLARISANLNDDDFLPLVSDTEIYHLNKSSDLIFLDSGAASGKRFIHGFDKNSAYMASARSYSFGLGDSIRYSGEFNKNYHGLWKVEISCNGLSIDNQKFIDIVSKTSERLWTSDIELIIELGAKVKVIDAEIWKCTKRVFEKFCKILKSARDEAKILELKIEESAIKSIYTKFFGWMNRQPDNDREEIFYRPDWYSAIISLTRANIIRNILQIRQSNADIELIGVNRDEIVIATNLEREELTFPLADKENRKSPFKHSFTFEQSEIAEIVKNASSGSDLSRKIKAYKKESTIKKSNDRLSKLKISRVRANV